MDTHPHSDSNAPETHAPRARRTESAVEPVKRNSRQLRGTLGPGLADPAPHFSDDDVQLLKFHGIYQCDNRDTRAPRKEQGLEPEYYFMIRAAIPGGVLTAEQYLALDEVADTCANGTLRVTTRQNVQFHGVYKQDLKRLIAALHARLMTTLAGCGDVQRNVMAPPAPLADPVYVEVRRLAREIAAALRPATRAYYEVWLDGAKVATTEPEEPFYGAQYLPRKFKTGVTVAGDNTIDVYSDDCGLIAIPDGARIRGFNLLAGGGFGMTHARADSKAMLAETVGFIGAEHAVEAVRTVAAIFRDHGNRKDRKHARLKYLMAEWGLERFRAEFRRRVAFELAPPAAEPPPGFYDCLGAHEQHDGRWFYGVFVQNGRIADRGDERLRTALRAIVQRYRPGVTLTPDQNVLLTDLPEHVPGELEAVLRAHGVRPARELTGARRNAVSCVALPTCNLAVTEAERVFPDVVAELEAELVRLGLDEEPLSVRMTGCPNACARPYTADIGFVGRKPGERYNIYVGGGLAGDRLADLFAEDIPITALLPLLRPLLEEFARRRHAGERLGDFYQRLRGYPAPRRVLTGREEETRGSLGLPVLP